MQVQLESPYGTRPDGTRALPEEVERNVKYALACMLDSLLRGESPFASHLLYTQVLDDCNPAHRELGISAGLEIGRNAKLCAVYEDYGLTPGMLRGIALAESLGIRVMYRRLPNFAERRAEFEKIAA